MDQQRKRSFLQRKHQWHPLQSLIACKTWLRTNSIHDKFKKWFKHYLNNFELQPTVGLGREGCMYRAVKFCCTGQSCIAKRSFLHWTLGHYKCDIATIEAKQSPAPTLLPASWSLGTSVSHDLPRRNKKPNSMLIKLKTHDTDGDRLKAAAAKSSMCDVALVWRLF